MKMQTKQLVLAGVMAALAMIGTMLIQVPAPGKGYIHIGDSIVYLCSILLGPTIGGLAAGLGSCLADLLSGYGIYAPATFVIKFLDAFAVGYLYRLLAKNGISLATATVGFLLGVVCGGAIMVGGYYFYESFLYGFATALANVPGNIIQATGGAVLAYPLFLALRGLKVLERR